MAHAGRLIPDWRAVFCFFVLHCGLDAEKKRAPVANDLFEDLFAIISEPQKCGRDDFYHFWPFCSMTGLTKTSYKSP